LNALVIPSVQEFTELDPARYSKKRKEFEDFSKSLIHVTLTRTLPSKKALQVISKGLNEFKSQLIGIQAKYRKKVEGVSKEYKITDQKEIEQLEQNGFPNTRAFYWILTKSQK